MYKNKLILISVIFLTISVFFTIPFYGFYTLLRLIISITSTIIALQFHNKNKQNYALIYWGIMLIFNPIIPIYLNKILWKIIDLLVIYMFLKELEVEQHE